MDPGQISRWLDANLWKFDGPEAFLGDEPGSVRKSWDKAQVRMLLAASWPYMQAAGNNSVPVVYRSVNDYEPALCDRFYLPATPRDFRLLERGGLPVFGTESKHSARDFDVLATSISYTVLWVNFCQYLRISGIPLRWRDRRDRPEDYPMVMVGGQAFCAPEFMAPVADCIFLGEAEDEPGNPGIQQVMGTIMEMKQDCRWQQERERCYQELAREFNFLYFPRFAKVKYHYEDRGLPEQTKMVSAIESDMPGDWGGVPVTFKSRRVKDIDAITPYTEAPLLYSDPGMGAGDIEAARGCPAWCSFPLIDTEPVITREGVMPIGWMPPDKAEVWTPEGWRWAEAQSHGQHEVQRITFVPATPSGWGRTDTCRYGHERSPGGGRCVECRNLWKRNDYYKKTGRPEKVVTLEPLPEWRRYGMHGWRKSGRTSVQFQVTATPCHGWELVSGLETHALKEGDVVRAGAVEPDQDSFDYKRGWLHGMVFGDGSKAGGRHVTGYRIRLHGEKDQAHLWRFQEATYWNEARDGMRTVSITYPHHPVSPDGEPSVWVRSRIPLKSYPDSLSSPEYFCGFMDGWLAADSSGRSDGKDDSYLTRRLYSQRPDAREWLTRYAAMGGWVLVGHSVNEEPTNYGPRSDPMNAFTLSRVADYRAWKVERIEPLPGTQEVFCLTVPGVRRFTLASGIMTGNCRLSWVTKPYREHSVDYLANQAAQWRLNMGSNELSPYGPDFPMYTRKKELLGRLLETVSDEVDTGAMRVDDFTTDPDYSMLLAFGGTDAVTLGLEGNSQRMRDLVGKGVSDKDVEAAVERAIRAGIKKVKLFMISNMPGEEAGDVMRIVKLARRLAEIREQMGVQGVRIQLSWTPLLIEAQTPMQWFAPTAPDYTLQQAMAELRDLHVEMKLGSKAQPEKIALFQACQRASRDAGEAITDVIEDLGTGCWGGVAKDMKERLDKALQRHGFKNGLADLYGERYRDDLFGWEHIDTGVSKDLMWDAYRRMVRFLEGTDAESYDGKFDQNYHGAEWIPRCDQHCSGNACGCCDKGDLLIRQQYIKAVDRDLGQQPVQPLDQTTVACKVWFRYERSEKHRYVSNAHWKFAIRRAAYRAAEQVPELPPIAKRSIRIVSDAYKYRDRSAGVDYAEFAFTRMKFTYADENRFMAAFAAELKPWLTVQAWERMPASAVLPSTPTSLWELEVDGEEDALAAALRAYDGSDYVKVLLKQESFYSGMSAEEANAKDHIADAWLARDRDRLVLRMVLNGKLGPYQAYAPLLGKKSWVDAMRHPARRIAFYDGLDLQQASLIRPVCIGCGHSVPAGLLGEVFDRDYCPRCRDEAERTAVTGLARAV